MDRVALLIDRGRPRDQEVATAVGGNAEPTRKRGPVLRGLILERVTEPLDAESPAIRRTGRKQVEGAMVPTRVATTGVPQDKDSSATRPKLSYRDGTTTMSALL